MSAPRWLARTGKAVAWALVGLVLLVAGLAVFLQTPPGETAFGSALESVVSSMARGRLVVGQVDDLGWDGSVHASNVRVMGPFGGKVLGAQALDVQPAVEELLSGRIVLSGARWSGGGFQIDEVPAGATEIEHAFKSPKKKKKEKKKEGKSALASRLDLQDIQFQNLVALFDLGGVPKIRLEEAAGRAHLWLDEKGQAQLRVQDARAHWAKPNPLGMTGTLRKIRGRVDGGARKVADFRCVAELGDGTFDVRIRYYNVQKGPKVKLAVQGDGLSATMLGALGLNIVSEFVGPLSMNLSLAGAEDGFDVEPKLRDSEGNAVKGRWGGTSDTEAGRQKGDGADAGPDPAG